LDLLHNQIH